MMIALSFILVFAVYSLLLFLFSGFDSHTAGFWIGWGFSLFSALLSSGLIAYQGKSIRFFRDWLFNQPIARRTAAYYISTLILSLLAAFLDRVISWKIVLSLGVILTLIYALSLGLVFINLRLSKDTRERVKAMTEKHKTMLMQLEGIKGSVKDEKTLSSLSTLIESIRYMDPVSSSSEKEDELSNAIKEVERIAASGGKPEKAIEKAKDAAEVLRKERKSRKN